MAKNAFVADVMNEACPSRALLNHVTSRWGVLILLALEKETLRFSELRRRIGGVSERMLSHALKILESDGFLKRRSFPIVPPHVEYSLTAHGRDAAKQVRTLATWLEQHVMDMPESSALRKARTLSD